MSSVSQIAHAKNVSRRQYSVRRQRFMAGSDYAANPSMLALTTCSGTEQRARVRSGRPRDRHAAPALFIVPASI